MRLISNEKQNLKYNTAQKVLLPTKHSNIKKEVNNHELHRSKTIAHAYVTKHCDRYPSNLFICGIFYMWAC